MRLKELPFLFGLLALGVMAPAWLSPANAESVTRGGSVGNSVSFENAPSAYPGCGGVTAPVVNADSEQQVVDLVNTQRASQGLPPLKRVIELDQAARYHATDLGQDNYFQHDSYDGSGGTTFVCAWSTRIGSYYSNANSLA